MNPSIAIPAPTANFGPNVMIRWRKAFFEEETVIHNAFYSIIPTLSNSDQFQRYAVISKFVDLLYQAGWRFFDVQGNTLSLIAMRSIFISLYTYRMFRNNDKKPAVYQYMVMPRHLQTKNGQGIKDDCQLLEAIIWHHAPVSMRDKFFNAKFMCSTHQVGPNAYAFVDEDGSCTMVPTSRLPTQTKLMYPHLIGVLDSFSHNYFWMLDCHSEANLSGLRCVKFSHFHGGSVKNKQLPYQSTFVVECLPEDGAIIHSLKQVLKSHCIDGFVKTQSLVKAFRVWEFRSGQFGTFSESGASVALIRDNGDMNTPIIGMKYVIP